MRDLRPRICSGAIVRWLARPLDARRRLPHLSSRTCFLTAIGMLTEAPLTANATLTQALLIRRGILTGRSRLLVAMANAGGVVGPASRLASRRHEKEAYAQQRNARACAVIRFAVLHLRTPFLTELVGLATTPLRVLDCRTWFGQARALRPVRPICSRRYTHRAFVGTLLSSRSTSRFACFKNCLVVIEASLSHWNGPW